LALSLFAAFLRSFLPADVDHGTLPTAARERQNLAFEVVFLFCFFICLQFLRVGQLSLTVREGGQDNDDGNTHTPPPHTHTH
jgi:hypothetical protein